LEIIKKEFKKLDEFYEILKEDLAENSKCEKIIDAMIQHYIIKLKIIDNLKTITKNLKINKNLLKNNK